MLRHRVAEVLKRLVPHLSYANVISTLCLFLLVAGGTAFAGRRGQPGRREHGVQVHPGLDAHVGQHVDQVLRGDVAAGSGRERRAAQPPDARVELLDAPREGARVGGGVLARRGRLRGAGRGEERREGER